MRTWKAATLTAVCNILDTARLRPPPRVAEDVRETTATKPPRTQQTSKRIIEVPDEPTPVDLDITIDSFTAMLTVTREPEVKYAQAPFIVDSIKHWADVEVELTEAVLEELWDDRDLPGAVNVERLSPKPEWQALINVDSHYSLPKSLYQSDDDSQAPLHSSQVRKWCQTARPRRPKSATVAHLQNIEPGFEGDPAKYDKLAALRGFQARWMCSKQITKAAAMKAI
ncbi:hypothetical protein G7K_3622-t1 [Saitoella complicata NRRL Y-17804]|uniref:Uncharacterized protein n=1 Tax=Saitoella complicata (strain BCRC 22490 / CBS 7301 / JCM 7358 / NBRC 10748 / NRRL Y-17804) TaxID=698492 RepID=A0A0E9NHY0_SAICN|nr:hypothetical protein G7K_3622-t1 [Saitoella complicata NRRL Y-17804]